MGIMDRDYYKEGTEAEVKAHPHHQGRQQHPGRQPNQAQSVAASAQFSALCIHCNARLAPNTEICPNCKQWQYTPVATEVAGQQYYPFQNQPPPAPAPLPNSGWTSGSYQPAPKRGIPAPAWAAIIGLLVIACLLLAIIAALIAKNGPSTTSQVAENPTTVPIATLRPTTESRPSPTAFVQPTVAPIVQPQQAQSATPSNLITGNVGQALQGPGYQLIVNSAEQAQTYGQFIKAAQGKMFVSVDVTIESQQNKDVSVNPYLAKLVDSQGYAYTFTLIGKDPALHSQNDLAAGQKMRGWITFEVPAGDSGLKFQYSQLSFTNSVILSVQLN